MNIPLILVFTPIFAYIIAGSLKFLMNSFNLKKLAFSDIGMGGFPSTHNTITSSCSSVVFMHFGAQSVEFMICLTFSLIVAIDSMDLRQKIAKHAKEINILKNNSELRESIGHKPNEVLRGIIIGIVSGLVLYLLFGN